MRGTYHLISDLTRHLRIEFEQPPALPDLWELAGGQVEPVEGFTCYVTSEGPIPCLAYRLKPSPRLQTRHHLPNHLATFLWQLSRAGCDRDAQTDQVEQCLANQLQGPIVVVTGDPEFLRELHSLNQGEHSR